MCQNASKHRYDFKRSLKIFKVGEDLTSIGWLLHNLRPVREKV